MSIWKAENSMLTTRGVEILNKIKAGVGSITVTRIVAGSGRIAESHLSNMTAMNGTLKEMTISKKDVRNSGSEVAVYIVNSDFTESFTLNQIGVYVTHPDYDGEQLYHISQCEEDGADLIPALTETPVTFGYSLFLEHGNSSSINLTVDPQGMVPVLRFNNLIENLIPGHLVVSDEGGNLHGIDKTASELCNQNLLVNSYFKNPVNRKNRFIIPPNTSYYSDSGLTTRVGTTSAYALATKLTSTYGYITVNSQVYYISWNSVVKGHIGLGVTVDRWKVSNADSIYAILDTNGVLFGNSGSVTGIVRQSTPLTISQADGHKLTISVLTSDNRLFTSTTSVYSYTADRNVASVTVDGVSIYVNCNVSGIFEVQIHLPANKEINIQAIKLEMGTQQTLVHQDTEENWVINEIPNFSEESAKCAQYSLTNDNYLGSVPYGYIEEEISVRSAEELDARLKLIFEDMPNGKVKHILVYFSASHPILGGSNRVMEITKSEAQYGVIKATSYAAEYIRTISNGVWSEWGRVYTAHNKPNLAELGAAPAGFGLGESAVKVYDANSIIKNGFYVCDTNTPDNGWWYGLHIQYYSDYAYQEFTRYNDTNTRICRVKIAGVWKPWEYITAPMSSGIEYRTTERYLGKAVFKKVDSNGVIMWRVEDETAWRTSGTSTFVSDATVG